MGSKGGEVVGGGRGVLGIGFFGMEVGREICICVMDMDI